jgi:hypothetical protein
VEISLPIVIHQRKKSGGSSKNPIEFEDTSDAEPIPIFVPDTRPNMQSSRSNKKRKATQDLRTVKGRPRVAQLSQPIPHTPSSVSESGTATPTSTAITVDESDPDTPTPHPFGRAKIWSYYKAISDEGPGKNKVGECKGCGKEVKGQRTSNFLDHQKMYCTGLLAAYRRGVPGICCPVYDSGVQANIDATSGRVIKPFNLNVFLKQIIKWIIVSGLPFSTIQNPHLREAI